MKFSKNGYKDNSKDKNNPVNFIKGNKVTMSGVSQPIMAIPYDKQGNPLPMRIMQPDQDYDFGEEVSYVMEFPYKVSMQPGGQTPVYGPQQEDPNALLYTSSINPYTPQTLTNQILQQSQARQVEVGRPQLTTANQITPQGLQAIGTSPEQQLQEYGQTISEQELVPQPGYTQNNGLGFGLPEEQKNQFFNPYGGYDIPTAAFTLGQSIESGNTLGTVGSSLKLLSGLGRNLVSGMGQMNRQQFVLNEANQNRRDNLTQTKFGQKGGQVKDSEWLVNWFNNPEAKKRLSNLQQGGSAGNTPYIMPENAQMNPQALIEDSRDFVTNWLNNPETRRRYLANTGAASDAILDTSIENINTANVRTDKYYDDGIKGEYNPGSHSIAFYGQPTPETAVHEFTHSGAESLDRVMSGYISENYGSPYEALRKNTGAQTTEEAIQRRYNIDPSTTFGKDKVQQQKNQLNYLTNPQGGELYPRIMEMRRNLGVEPGQIITDEQIQQLQSNPEVNELFNIYEPAQIQEMLNTMANTDNNQQDLYYAQKGGKIGEKLTGNYVSGDKSLTPTVEVERGEYMKFLNGDVAEVTGKKHSEGGEEMDVAGGTKVISDFTKVGGKNAKFFKDEFSIKTKANDTYSDILDKYSKQIGLKDLVEEQESIIEEIEKQKDTDNKSTFDLNMQFLSERMKEIEEEKKPLEELQKEAFEKVFTKQEDSKPKEERAQIEMKMGGEIDALASKYKLSKDKIKKIMENGGYTEEDRRGRFVDFYNQMVGLGFEGDIDVNAEDLGPEAGKLQQWLAKNKPEQVINYFKNGIPITSKGVDIIKEKNPKLFEELGLDINKPAGEFTNEERVALQNKFSQTDQANDEFWLDQFQDGRWDFRYVNFPIDIQSGTGAGTLPTATPPTNISTEEVARTINPNTVENNTGEDIVDNTGNTLDILNLPDQTPLPPSVLQPQLKADVRLQRMEPTMVSPEAALTEIERQSNAAEQQLNFIPDAQRQAVIAQMLANTQNASNQAVLQSEIANQQAQAQADQFNIQQTGREDILNLENAMSYEAKIQTGMSNYEQSVRNYFNAMQQNQLGKYNEINRVNLLNQMYDNFQYTGDGSIQQVGQPQFEAPLIRKYGGSIKDKIKDYLKNN